MATIYGSFTGKATSIVRPYITYTYTQDIPNNTSEITAKLYFVKYNASYWFYNTGGFPNNIKIDTSTASYTDTFDLRSSSVPEIELIRTRVYTVTHNADGTRTCYIGANGDTEIVLGTYNFGSTVTLDTIPREATITNNVSFEVEDDIPLTIDNPANYWLKALLYVDGTLIKTQELGQTTSTTLTLNSTEDDAIYAEMPNVTSEDMYVRLKTYSDSGYVTQLGDDQDKSGTVTIDQDANKPTFTSIPPVHIDKTVIVKDKYDNTLVTSQTLTLSGGAGYIIANYNTFKQTINTGDKAVALNSATMVKYILANTASGQTVEEDYHATNTVYLTIENAVDDSNIVYFNSSAVDSRSLTKTNTIGIIPGNVADYTDIVLSGLTATRDNNVDALTKIAFSGTAFDGYFGGGAIGVENVVTARYRYKESTDTWGSQTWNSITVTDTAGALSFDDYINGDLGILGFDDDKSFDIEVCVYDKLSAYILEVNLARGIPTVDFTQDGIAVGDRYDPDFGGESLQSHGKTLLYGAVGLYANEGKGVNGTAYIGGRDESDVNDVALQLRTQDGGSLENALHFKADGYLDASKSNSVDTSDTMGANSDSRVPTQKATKAYVDRKYSFRAYKSAWQYNLTDGTTYTVVCDTQYYDNNAVYNPSTGIFTAAIAGRYFFAGGVCMNTGSTSTKSVIAFHANTTRFAEDVNSAPTATSALFNTLAAQMYIGAGSTVKMTVNMYGTTNNADIKSGSSLTWFTGFYIGPI